VEVGTFVFLYSSNDFPALNAKYGFTQVQADAIFGYYKYVLSQTLDPVVLGGGGLFITRPAHDLLFGYTDPLLEIIAPSLAFVEVNRNYSSIEDAQNGTVESRTTGADHISKINQYVKWRGLDFVNVWQSPEPFKGTSGTQVPPGVNRHATQPVWSGTLQRNIDLAFNRTVEVKGITLDEFILPSSTLESAAKNPANAKYYTSIDGMHNMTSAELVPGAPGIPLFVSKPYYIGVDPTVNSMVNLLLPDGTVQQGFVPNPEIHDTFVRLEPLTGAALDAALRLQINLLLKPELVTIYHPNTPAVYLPVYWAQESSTITDKQATSFKSSVYGAQKLGNALLVLFVVVGAILIAVGLAFISVPLLCKYTKCAGENNTEMDDLY